MSRSRRSRPAFAFDTERLARFEREAQALAALNHANIRYHELKKPVVRNTYLELVEGKTLAETISLQVFQTAPAASGSD